MLDRPSCIHTGAAPHVSGSSRPVGVSDAMPPALEHGRPCGRPILCEIGLASTLPS